MGYMRFYKSMKFFCCNRYLKNVHNCYDFVISFLQFLELDRFLPCISNKTDFCSAMVLPQTKRASKYISVYREVLQHSIFVSQKTSFWLDWIFYLLYNGRTIYLIYNEIKLYNKILLKWYFNMRMFIKCSKYKFRILQFFSMWVLLLFIIFIIGIEQGFHKTWFCITEMATCFYLFIIYNYLFRVKLHEFVTEFHENSIFSMVRRHPQVFNFYINYCITSPSTVIIQRKKLNCYQ